MNDKYAAVAALKEKYPVGTEMIYRGGWGVEAPVRVKIEGHGEKNSRLVMDADNGHWGYADQFSEIPS